MKFVFFYHAFTSCWNHGNAHFLRGVTRALAERGHQVTVYEPEDGWSRTNALADGGAAILEECAQLVPGVNVQSYRLQSLDLDRALEGAGAVIVHEWNDPSLVALLGRRRLMSGGFLLLFHDTHHRAVTAPQELARFALEPYDAILVFGEVLREVYLKRGWGRHVITWHEAADSALFRPEPKAAQDTDLIWIGNWGDGERDVELNQFLIEPASRAGIRARLHGVRYPMEVQDRLRALAFDCRGWLPNHRVPGAFGEARLTIHVPRRPYAETLRGIPTIRMFEALACGIPLICAPWHDTEGIFPEGSYLRVENGDECSAALQLLMKDRDLAAQMSATGLSAISARHTCAHRADELLAALERYNAAGMEQPQSQSQQMVA
jgi:spore maturation protein CgeB